MENKEKNIRELLKTINSISIYTIALKKAMETGCGLKRPQSIERIMKLLLSPENLEDFTKEMIRSYDAHFTASDIRELLKFYKSKLGRKVIAQMLSIGSSATEMAKRWQENFMEKYQKEIIEILDEDIAETQAQNDQEMIKKAEEATKFLRARYNFVQKYCEKKGWTLHIEELTFAQMQEIRAQEDWKNPKI